MQMDIRQLIVEVLGVAPLKIEYMSFGHTNKVFSVELPEDQVIIRINKDAGALSKTSYNISVLKSLGLPVPTVIQTDETMKKYPFSYTILRKIEGRDLRYEIGKMTKEQLIKLAKEIVSIQKIVSSLPKGEGFGWVPINDKGPFSSWMEIIDRDFHTHISSVENEIYSNQIKDVELLKNRFNDYFNQVEPICFLDDITIKNVIVLDGKLQGIIDLDWVCYGDPLYMIGLTQTAIISDIGEASNQYIEELCNQWEVTPFQRKIINFYSLLHAFRFIEFHNKNNDHRLKDRLISFISKTIESLK
jgi:aminoglycoside phosphotransferase (APT) family kinase protein